MRKPTAEKEAFDILLAAAKEEWEKKPPLAREEKPDRVSSPTLVLEGQAFSPSYASNILRGLEQKGLIRKVYTGVRGGQIIYIKILKEEFPEEFLQPQMRRRHGIPPKPKLAQMPKEAPKNNRAQSDSVQGDKVLTLIDYRNIVEGLNGTGKDFPVEELKELGRKYGIALIPRVYISHAVSMTAVMTLGRNGFLITMCPPQKLYGPDTVDEIMHGEATLFSTHPSIGTMILVSNDSDFRKTEDLIANHHKKVIVVKLDKSAGVLKSSDGQIIPLPALGISGEIVTEKNEFTDVVIRMVQGKATNLDRDRIWFIRNIAEACKNLYSIGEMQPPKAKSFQQLHNLIWQFVHRLVVGRFTERDCHQALGALLDHSDLILQRRQEASPRRYYIYNPKHTLTL